MMKRVLVPLDKTEAAEEILPLVAMLAKEGAHVRLMHVAPIPETVLGRDGHTIAYADQEIQSREVEGADYVYAVKARLGVDADTIAITTAAACTLTRAFLGGVTETLLRRAGVGVLLYRPLPGV